MRKDMPIENKVDVSLGCGFIFIKVHMLHTVNVTFFHWRPIEWPQLSNELSHKDLQVCSFE